MKLKVEFDNKDLDEEGVLKNILADFDARKNELCRLKKFHIYDCYVDEFTVNNGKLEAILKFKDVVQTYNTYNTSKNDDIYECDSGTDFTISHIEVPYRRIIYARKHFWNKWQGFEVKSKEAYRKWRYNHKKWHIYKIMNNNGGLSWPNVPIKEYK